MSGMDFKKQELAQAIYRLDVEGVKRAIKEGADVNANASPFDDDPLWLYQIGLHDHDVKRQDAFNKVWEVIVPKINNASQPSKYASCRGLSFQMVRLRNTEAASSIILSVIKETKGAARINLEEIFRGVGSAPEYEHPARLEYKEKIIKAHTRAMQRLKNPLTEFEREAAAALTSTGAKKYWLHPLDFPNLATLPIPPGPRGQLDLFGSMVPSKVNSLFSSNKRSCERPAQSSNTAMKPLQKELPPVVLEDKNPLAALLGLEKSQDLVIPGKPPKRSKNAAKKLDDSTPKKRKAVKANAEIVDTHPLGALSDTSSIVIPPRPKNKNKHGIVRFSEDKAIVDYDLR